MTKPKPPGPGPIAKIQAHGLSYVEAQQWLAEHEAAIDAEEAKRGDRSKAADAVWRREAKR